MYNYYVSDKFMKNVQSRIHVYKTKIHETLLLYLAHYPYIYLFNDLKFQTSTFEYCLIVVLIANKIRN